jgi:hypothetical protein
MKVFVSTDFVSRRDGNYKYCWLSGTSALPLAPQAAGRLWSRLARRLEVEGEPRKPPDRRA